MERTSQKRAQNLGLSKNKKILAEIEKSYRNSEPINDIALKLQLTPSQVSRIVYKVLKCPKSGRNSNQGRPKSNWKPELTEYQKDRIHQLALFDYTAREISEDTGVAVKSVKWTIESLNLAENLVELD